MNLQKAQTAAVTAARAAGALMRRHLFAAKKVEAATRHDIKLELDVRCQKLIERKLHAAFPQIAFLGEEETPRGAAPASDAEFRWVVDPIDGTVNFAHGIPHAAVSIALQRRISHLEHETIVGVIYDPFQDELWTAIRGRKARLNGRPIQASRRRRLTECIVTIGFAKSRGSIDSALSCFTWLVRRVRKVRMLGSAALALAYVATGRLDGYVERGVNLWDVAAGGLIVECAGGKFWMEPFKAGVRMVASNRAIHRQLPRPR